MQVKVSHLRGPREYGQRHLNQIPAVEGEGRAQGTAGEGSVVSTRKTLCARCPVLSALLDGLFL